MAEDTSRSRVHITRMSRLAFIAVRFFVSCLVFIVFRFFVV